MSVAKTTVILPALNEEPALSRLIPLIGRALTSSPFQIIVINDGSTDGTSALLSTLAAAWPVHELRHSQNQGYAAALRTAYQYVLQTSENPDDVVVAMDADGTQGPEYVPAMVDALRHSADVVTAAYDVPGGGVTGVPWFRRFMSRGINGLFGLFLPLSGVTTYTNGFRGYRVAALLKAQRQFGPHLIEENGFAGGTELFLKVAQGGARLTEIPFVLHYERRGGDSKIRFIPTIRGYLRLIVRAWSRFSR